MGHWGSGLGLQVLKGLSKLYTSLVWESTVLLAFCSEDILPPNCDFGKEDLDKLLPKETKDKDLKSKLAEVSVPSPKPLGSAASHHGEMGSNGVSAAMEMLSTSETTSTPMDNDDSQNSAESKAKVDGSAPDEKKKKMCPATAVSTCAHKIHSESWQRAP